MKTTEEIINQQPVYLHDWDKSKKFGIIADFSGVYMNPEEYAAQAAPYENKEYWVEKKEEMTKEIDRYKDVNILFASYSYANYSGDAWVLFEQDGQLFEVNGSHCSCYGLEGQWNKEPVVLEELKNRLEKGNLGTEDYCGNEFAAELKVFLGL